MKNNNKKINLILDNLSLLIPFFIGLYIIYFIVMSWGYSSAISNEYLMYDYVKCGNVVNSSDYADNTYKIKKYFNMYDDCIQNNNIPYLDKQ